MLIHLFLLVLVFSGVMVEDTRAQVPEIIFDPSLGVDLSAMTRSPSGLYSRVLEKGQGERATTGTSLEIEFTAHLPDGTQFGESVLGEPLEVSLGQTRMIAGFMEGLMGMRPGESRLIVIPPEIGYGTRGVDGVVPPSSTLVFRLKRVDGQ